MSLLLEFQKAFQPSVDAFSDFGSLGELLGSGPQTQQVASNVRDDLIGGDTGKSGRTDTLGTGGRPRTGLDILRQSVPGFTQDQYKIPGTDNYLFGEEARAAARSAAEAAAADKYGVKLEDLKSAKINRSVADRIFAAGDKAVENLGPGFAQKYGPAALGTLGVVAAAGGFEAPEMQKPNILPSGFGQQGVDPELVANYRLSEGSLNTAPTRTSPISARVAPRRQSDILRRRFPDLFDPIVAKDGGEVFPRRTGGIMPDEGVPGKDSVRAMVMPGEFIFTTDAVRGASPTGNLNDGINNMYSVMRKLESRGKRMA